MSITSVVRVDPDRTLPRDWTPAPKSGRAALIDKYGDHAEDLFNDFWHRAEAALDGGYQWLGLALLEAAAFWRQVADDRTAGGLILQAVPIEEEELVVAPERSITLSEAE